MVSLCVASLGIVLQKTMYKNYIYFAQICVISLYSPVDALIESMRCPKNQKIYKNSSEVEFVQFTTFIVFSFFNE